MSETNTLTKNKFSQLADRETIKKASAALEANGYEVEYVETKDEAKELVLSLIPEGSEVMTMSSRSLEQTGLTNIIDGSEKYVSIRNKLTDKTLTNQDKKNLDLSKVKKNLAYSVDYTVGSVHALTEDGQVLVASRSGSQLPTYIYGADKVIWVVGAQKIVKDVQEGIKRIYEHSFPLEDERVMSTYGFNSRVSNIWINSEAKPGRVTIVMVNEILGF